MKNNKKETAEKAAKDEKREPEKKEEKQTVPPDESKDCNPSEQEEKQSCPEKEAGEDKLATLQAKVEELEDQLLRKAAEFDNYRRRTLKEKEDISEMVKLQVVTALLPTLDNLERALAAKQESNDFTKGVEMVYNQLWESFQKLGVTEIEALEKEFDPNVHNAVSQVQDEAFGDNVVCQIFQKGYQMSGRVIRPVMVAVANP